MSEQNAQLAHVAFQRADGSTGVLDIHDEHAIPDEPNAIDSENLASGAVVNGKVAPDAITEVELADGAVSEEKLSPEMQEAWDSLCQPVTKTYTLDIPIGFKTYQYQSLVMPDGLKAVAVLSTGAFQWGYVATAHIFPDDGLFITSYSSRELNAENLQVTFLCAPA